ncbi:MAG: acetyl-CoA carboxylase biotin carboxylase subunit [Stellaceae bacterium]
MFKKLLIANRGEIAFRVIRTARLMGIATVAVYSEADAQALHVEAADEACLIGPAAARDSYLDIGRIVAAARQAGADAVHPGYGFLAENADFAEACTKAGLVFVGPSAAAIRAMGSKSEAKRLMELAGVPVVPGYHGKDQDPARFFDEARRIGFPVLIKPSVGGGGKGMHAVERQDDFAAALAAARREAASSFGDDRILIEKYLLEPRHIEVQVFGDRFGNLVHLFERDCSIQRRHQKVIEEAPAINLGEDMRRAMHEAAIAASRAVQYVNAGTIEFIVEGGDFYFMEMNTRLQVEHPVTEMITGLDLVEWQLRVAAGEALPLRQEDIAARGHAIEARLYAEDPERDFLPATGRIVSLWMPDVAPDLRIETGVRKGDRITPFYDPMIAKLVAWGDDRAAAIRRLGQALSEYRIAGVATNRDFLLRLVRLTDFAEGAVDTGFIGQHRDALARPSMPQWVPAVASQFLIMAERGRMRRGGDPHSPWSLGDGWRLDDQVPREFHWRDDTEVRVIRGDPLSAATWGDDVEVVRDCNRFTIIDGDGTWQIDLVDPLAERDDEAATAGRLSAPMPGKVIEVLVAAGAKVKRGQPILILEAMKMEHTIAAPSDGTIDAVHYGAGDLVAEGADLVDFTAAED